MHSGFHYVCDYDPAGTGMCVLGVEVGRAGGGGGGRVGG